MSAPCKNDSPSGATIIGAGLSGLLLAHHLAQKDDEPIFLYDDATPRPDHMWGYWDGGEPYLDTPRNLARGQWRHWMIATPHGSAVLCGETTAYRAVSSAAYETHLSAALDNATRLSKINRRFSETEADEVDGRLFDTAHYQAPPQPLLQHFGGHEVVADRPCFDAETAILMDFRVPQNDGIHFIYLLPYDPQRALVESTVFSPSVLAPAWYAAQIDDYLATHYDGVGFDITARENGIIPMAPLRHSGPGIGIGLAGGALRASSGYAFHQIHRQIDGLTQSGVSHPRPGTSRFERWMDKIFLRVLRRQPHIAPHLFLRLAQRMSGDEFAAFMNGQAPTATLLRVILAMPKSPFLRSLI